ncbi:hypothetical protein [Tateyamaria sp.]|uniref:hypothetical protein n=1 Tax=Tateyamaria sp. TaxID=1929288 RepID=UPI003281E466
MRRVFKVTGIKVFIVVSLLSVMLAGCVDPPGPVASDQSFRVTSVSAQVFKKGDRRVPLLQTEFEHIRLSTINAFGLNQNRVLADLKQVMANSLIPASRQGKQEVRAEFVLYTMRLRTVSETFTNLVGWLDFYDAKSGAQLASVDVAISPMTGMKASEVRRLWRTTGNVVQEYESLMDLAKDTMPKYLPRP